MSIMTALRIAFDSWQAKRGGPAAIAARQQARLAGLVAFARQNSRFYAEKYQQLPERITDVRQLPVVTKAELMRRFDDWVTDPAVTRERVSQFVADLSLVGHNFLGRYGVWTTSGSTGEPAMLVHDAHSLAVMTANSLVHSPYTMADYKRMFRGGARVAGVYATGGHFLGYSMVRRRILERPSKANSFRIFSVLDPLPQLVQGLNQFQPAMLGGYASALQLLAEEQKAGRLGIHPAFITSGGEWLSPAARAEIESAFGARVVNTYGCSETGPMGFDCGHGWMHVPAEWVILEPVDAAYRPVAPGELSTSLLITYLGNRVQPIIRYELGDRVLVNPEPCPCGSPLPAVRVEGRTDDILTFQAAGGAPVRVLPLALSSVMKETPGVHRYQLLQTGPAQLDIRLEPKVAGDKLAVWARAEERVTAFLGSQGLQDCTVRLAAEPPQADARSGKFRHVWREFK